jgi:hypothetical protein
MSKFFNDLRETFIELKKNYNYQDIKFGCYYELIQRNEDNLQELIDNYENKYNYTHINYTEDDTEGYTDGELIVACDDITYTIELNNLYDGNSEYYPTIHITKSLNILDADMSNDIDFLETIESNFENNINDADKFRKKRELASIEEQINTLLQKKSQLEFALRS